MGTHMDFDPSGPCCQQTPSSQLNRNKPSASLYEHSKFISSIKNSKVLKNLKKQRIEQLPKTTLKDVINVDSGKYYGQVNQAGQPNGLGQLFTGKSYIYGNFKNGRPNGKTNINFLDTGYLYSGQVNQGALQRGTLQTDEFTYTGEFQRGVPHGQGEQWDMDGNYFKGTFFQGKKRFGKMIYKLHPSIASYQGQINPQKNCQCKIHYRNGQTFEGFTKGEQLIEGKYVYYNGDIYEGPFRDGQRSGDGKYLFAAEGKLYQGEFRNNLRDGQGRLISQEGSVAGRWKRGVKVE